MHTDPVTGAKYLTIGDVARILRVSKMTVYRQVRAGKLESVLHDGAHAIPEHAVRDWLGGPYRGAGTVAGPVS